MQLRVLAGRGGRGARRGGRAGRGRRGHRRGAGGRARRSARRGGVLARRRPAPARARRRRRLRLVHGARRAATAALRASSSTARAGSLRAPSLDEAAVLVLPRRRRDRGLLRALVHRRAPARRGARGPAERRDAGGRAAHRRADRRTRRCRRAVWPACSPSPPGSRRDACRTGARVRPAGRADAGRARVALRSRCGPSARGRARGAASWRPCRPGATRAPCARGGARGSGRGASRPSWRAGARRAAAAARRRPHPRSASGPSITPNSVAYVAPAPSAWAGLPATTPIPISR